MEQCEVETLAAVVRRAAGVKPGTIPRSPELVAGILGRDAIAIAPTLSPSACLTVVGGRYRILIREVHTDTNFDVAHELAHAVLRGLFGFTGLGQDSPREERRANALAAAMIAPADLVRRMLGKPLREMATTFGLSQTAMFLRLGEVKQDERAVVTRSGNVILRTMGAFPWASVPVVALAQPGARWRGVSKARLRGGIDEGRVVMIATA